MVILRLELLGIWTFTCMCVPVCMLLNTLYSYINIIFLNSNLLDLRLILLSEGFSTKRNSGVTVQSSSIRNNCGI